MLLIFAPLRSVFAMQLMAGDMDVSTSNTASSSVIVNPAVLSVEHCQHMMDSTQVDDRTAYQLEYVAKSCCNDNGPCKSNCHFAMSVSLFMQHAGFSFALLNVATFDAISSTLLVRELSPPSRPPLSLYS